MVFNGEAHQEDSRSAAAKEHSDCRRFATDFAFWPLEFAQSRAEIIYIFMSCDLCNCDDHPNMPCPNCLNCIQHYTTEADYDEVHYDFSEHTAHSTHKPHYKYNGATGEITLVNAEQSTAQTDCTADLIAESYGL